MFKALAPVVLFLLSSLGTFRAMAGEPVDAIVSADEPWHVAIEGIEFPDGLSCDAEGNLYYSDLNGKSAGVFRLAPDGAKTKISEGGRSGTRLGTDGKLYGVGGGELTAFDLQSNEKRDIASGFSTNDLAVSKNGHAYLTETGKKQVTEVNLQTGATAPADIGITAPNGIGLSPDHGTLYVSDFGGTKVWAFKVQADGKLAEKKALMTMDAPEKKPDVAAGDGLAVDEAGRVYVTTALGVQVFESDGKKVGTIANAGSGSCRSIAFAGKNHDLLYLASGNRIYVRKAKVRGVGVIAEQKSN